MIIELEVDVTIKSPIYVEAILRLHFSTVCTFLFGTVYFEILYLKQWKVETYNIESSSWNELPDWPFTPE